MERIPQRNAMQIVYYDTDSYREVVPPQHDTFKFLDFEYQYDLSVTEDMQGITSQHMAAWAKDVNELKQGKYDRVCAAWPYTHFTKLAYMYVELSEDKHYKYPIFYSPHGHAINGGSRMLVQSQYFPHLKWDAVRYNFENAKSNTIQPIVDAILKNSYWKNTDNISTRVRALLWEEKQFTDSTEHFYSLADISFTQHPPFVFGKDWHYGADFLEAFDYSILYEKISRTQILWNNIKDTINRYPANTPEDYKDLLDLVVLGNVDFVKKWREDFL